MTSDLKNKTILIAGGASGAGFELAKRGAASGADIHIVGRSDRKLAAAKAALGVAVTTHRLDISDEAAVKSLAMSLTQIDHIVSTAADLSFEPFSDLSNEEINESSPQRSAGQFIWYVISPLN